METNLKSNDSHSIAIVEARQLVEKMLEIAEKGIVRCEDNGCMLVYGIIRDCGYKIRRTVEQEQVSVQRKVVNDEFLH